MKTIVAVTAQNRKTIFEHAGKCRNFLIYTIKNNVIATKKLLELSKEETLHHFFHQEKDNNSTASSLFDIDILLTKGIGEGAIQKLAKQNVACYIIKETDPDTAINKLISGTLETVSPVSHNKSGHNCNSNTQHNHHSH